jgi:sec-independent protein translocase protein TatC
MENTQDEDNNALTLIDHLEELRIRIIKALIVTCALCFVMYFFSLPAIEWLKRVFCPELKELVYLHPMELFFTRLKMSFFMGIIAGFPYIAYQIWGFVSPALFPKERFWLARFVIISSFLFLAGGAFAIFGIYPAVIRFSMGMASSDITPMISVQSFVNLAAMLALGFGLMFQLPIFVFILASTGLIPVETMSKARPIIVVVIFLLSAILTPPDVLSQLAMGLPTLALFEISLLFSKLARTKAKPSTSQNS